VCVMVMDRVRMCVCRGPKGEKGERTRSRTSARGKGGRTLCNIYCDRPQAGGRRAIIYRCVRVLVLVGVEGCAVVVVLLKTCILCIICVYVICAQQAKRSVAQVAGKYSERVESTEYYTDT